MSPHAVMKNASIFNSIPYISSVSKWKCMYHVIHLRLGMYPSLNTVGAGHGYED